MKKYDTIREDDTPDYEIVDYRLVLQDMGKNKEGGKVARVMLHVNIPNETEQLGSGCGGALILSSQELYIHCAEQAFDTLKYGKFRKKRLRK